MHGGTSYRGIASPTYRHGGYSGDAIARIL